METDIFKSRMTTWIFIVAWIYIVYYPSDVWGMDLCADESETTRSAELAHNAFPEWTTQRKCECNITSKEDAYITLHVHFQSRSARPENCNSKTAPHMLLTSTGKQPSNKICTSEKTNVSLTISRASSDKTTILLDNNYARELRFHVTVRATKDINIKCGSIAVGALVAVPVGIEDDEGYSGGEIGAIAAGVVSGTIMLLLIVGGILDTKGKCNWLFPSREDIYASRDEFNDGVGDNPAYQVTPQSSIASSVVNITNDNTPGVNKPNGELTKKGFINKAFGTKPLASFRKHKYRPEASTHQTIDPNNSLYKSPGDSVPKHVFGPQDPECGDRYETPPESLGPDTLPSQIHPVSTLPDSNMNTLHEPVQRTSSGDRPLEVGNPADRVYTIPQVADPAIIPTTQIKADQYSPQLPSNIYESPADVRTKQPINNNRQSTASQPYTGHPHYPHYGNLSPPFNVSADSIIYMDSDDLDDFFLRQNRKPQLGFLPDPSERYTPVITKLYRPGTQNRDTKPQLPRVPQTSPPKPFQPMATPKTHGNPFRNIPDDSTLGISPLINDIMESPVHRDLQSPVESEFASPMDTPTHRPYGPISSITSTPSHASGYMTPPENIVEMRRSSASPHLDNFAMESKSFETDV